MHDTLLFSQHEASLQQTLAARLTAQSWFSRPLDTLGPVVDCVVESVEPELSVVDCVVESVEPELWCQAPKHYTTRHKCTRPWTVCWRQWQAPRGHADMPAGQTALPGLNAGKPAGTSTCRLLDACRCALQAKICQGLVKNTSCRTR